MTEFLIPQSGGISILDGKVGDLFHTMVVTQASSLTVIVQSPFSNSLLATLPEDQALAAKHAQAYERGEGFGYAPAFIIGLRGIATTVNALLTEGALPVAVALDREDANNARQLVDFRAVLGAIAESATSLSEGQSGNLSLMKRMETSLQILAEDISNDATRLSTAIAEVKDQNLIGKLKKQQDDLQEQLDDINREIAEGALSKIPEIITFGFEVGQMAGEAFSVVGAGVAAYGLAKEVIDYNNEIAETYKKQAEIGGKISALATEIKRDQLDYATLTLTAAQIKIFNTQVQKVLADMGSILDQMSGWRQQIDQLSDFSKPPSKGFFTQQVKNGQAYWADLAANLSRYESITNQTRTGKT